ncbi:MAG: hypothetical protein F4W89_08145 [Acidobacteria bacterium]|nr:hypothetical protein [Acidobacteriota bacterium]
MAIPTDGGRMFSVWESIAGTEETHNVCARDEAAAAALFIAPSHCGLVINDAGRVAFDEVGSGSEVDASGQETTVFFIRVPNGEWRISGAESDAPCFGQSDGREEQAGGREEQAGGREEQAGGREQESDLLVWVGIPVLAVALAVALRRLFA